MLLAPMANAAKLPINKAFPLDFSFVSEASEVITGASGGGQSVPSV